MIRRHLNKLALMLFLTPGLVWADLYRCGMPNGKVEYQQQPCIAGSNQRTIDDSETIKRRQLEAENARNRLSKAQADSAAEKAEKNGRTKIEQNAKMLKACKAREIECEGHVYRQGLKCMTTYDVAEVFGDPDRIQNIGGEKYLYYNVPLSYGAKVGIGRLQLIVGYCGDIPMPNPNNRVKEVNIY